MQLQDARFFWSLWPNYLASVVFDVFMVAAKTSEVRQRRARVRLSFIIIGGTSESFKYLDSY